jgi:hypothetical protein
MAYYFSTHGCRRLDSCFVDGALEELASAAASLRARMSKKLAMLRTIWRLIAEGESKSRANIGDAILGGHVNVEIRQDTMS